MKLIIFLSKSYSDEVFNIPLAYFMGFISYQNLLLIRIGENTFPVKILKEFKVTTANLNNKLSTT